MSNPLESVKTDEKMFFHLILADVVFETKRGGVTSMRAQFITQAATDEFPAARIAQLQNSAALIIRERLPVKDAIGFKTHDVLLLTVHPCGHMTTNEFYANVGESKEDIPEPEKTQPSNVVPFDQQN